VTYYRLHIEIFIDKFLTLGGEINEKRSEKKNIYNLKIDNFNKND